MPLCHDTSDMHFNDEKSVCCSIDEKQDDDLRSLAVAPTVSRR